MIFQALALEEPRSNDYHHTMNYSGGNSDTRPGGRSAARSTKTARKTLAGLPNGARVILAPLCGITNAVFRKICFDHGAEMAVTEMVSSEALTRGDHKRVRAIKGLDVTEGPLSLQIIGANPDRMGETAARLSEFGPEYIDINFGCPVKKVVTRNGGAAVLKDLKLLGAICREVVRRSLVPVSAKIRAGWDSSSGNCVGDLSRAVEDAGVSMLTVHARTRAQGFDGPADWTLIAAAKEAVSIPVVGNGDVASADDLINMHEATGCDAVMIGRAAIGNPWVFDLVRSRLDGGVYKSPSLNERVSVLLRHVRDSVAIDGEPLGLVSSRKVISAYLKRLPNVRELRGKLMQTSTLAALEDLLERYLEEAQLNGAREDLQKRALG